MIQARDHVLGTKIQVGPEHDARLGLQKCRIAGIDIMRAGEAGQGRQGDQSKAAQCLNEPVRLRAAGVWAGSLSVMTAPCLKPLVELDHVAAGVMGKKLTANGWDFSDF